jgi:hypothetical protein
MCAHVLNAGGAGGRGGGVADVYLSDTTTPEFPLPRVERSETPIRQ